MKTVVADTHAAHWFLVDDNRLTQAATDALVGAERILLPSISLVEITYLIEKNRIHEAVLPRLLGELDNPISTLELAALDMGVVLSLQDIRRSDVPDLPDRVIAATALYHRVPLVTCDRNIRSCGIPTIW
jgi:PIN domain nuclease of toxin-antitoxin system